MRTLIDGYNLMYAGGLLGRKFGPDGFRQVRHRFLNELASTLDATEAHLTTVVFDAADAPPDRASSTHHKGLTVLYAVDVEDADTRIEELIAHHSSPKTLTVVSSDHRIQKAASRRKSKFMTADAYWTELDHRKAKRHQIQRVPEPDPRSTPPSPTESAFWEDEFREMVEMEAAKELFERDPIFPTDAELARIEREVEDEFRRR